MNEISELICINLINVKDQKSEGQVLGSFSSSWLKADKIEVNIVYEDLLPCLQSWLAVYIQVTMQRLHFGISSMVSYDWL